MMRAFRFWSDGLTNSPSPVRGCRRARSCPGSAWLRGVRLCSSAGRGSRGGSAFGGSRLRPSHRCRRAGSVTRLAQRCFETLRHVGQALIGRRCGFRRGRRPAAAATVRWARAAVRREVPLAARSGIPVAALARLLSRFDVRFHSCSSGSGRAAAGRLRDGAGGRVESSSASAASVSRCGRGGGSAAGWNDRAVTRSGSGSTRGSTGATPPVPAAAAKPIPLPFSGSGMARGSASIPAVGRLPAGRAVRRPRARYWVRPRRRSGRRSSTGVRHCRAAPG